MNNTKNIIEHIMTSIKNGYNGNHDLFNDEIQVNITDARLLEIVSFQQSIIEDLTARLSRLEVFTGMVAPAPLPVDDSMSMHFVNGEVDYIEPGALIDNDMDEITVLATANAALPPSVGVWRIVAEERNVRQA